MNTTMKKCIFLFFLLLGTLSLQAQNDFDLTLIPPGKITNKVNLDIRAGIVNRSNKSQEYEVDIYWNAEKSTAVLHQSKVVLPAGKSKTIKIVIPTNDKVGMNKVILKVKNQGKVIMGFNGKAVVEEYKNSGSSGFVAGKHEVLPIPATQITLNDNMVQNPGW